MSENTTATAAQASESSNQYTLGDLVAERVAETDTTTQPTTEPTVEVKEFKFKPRPRLMGPAQAPVMLKSVHGVTPMFGTEFVGKRTATIFERCLNLPVFDSADMDHGVRAIVCRTDGYPYFRGAPALGSFNPDTFSISINLLHIFSLAVEGAIDMKEFSVTTLTYNRLLTTFLHELHHCHMLATDEACRRAFYSNDEKALDELEDMADKFASSSLIELAKTVNIEPDHITQMPFFANQIFEMLRSDMASSFVKRQAKMLDENILFEKKETESHLGYKLFVYKDIVHRISGEPLDDPSWNPASAGVNPTLLEQLRLHPQNQPEDPAIAVAEAQAKQAANTVILTEDVYDENYGYETDADLARTYPQPVQSQTQAETTWAWQPKAPPPMDEHAGGFSPPSTQMPVFNPATGPSPVGYQPQTNGHTPNSNMPDHGFTGQQVREITFGVYNRIVAHIWNRCGKPTVFPTADTQGYGTNIINVCNCFREPIELSPEEKLVVVGFDHLNPDTGHWETNIPTANGLFGFVGKNAQIPIYKIHINSGQGIETLRLIMPQNPNNSSKSADEARRGVHIVFVMDGADRGGDLKGKFLWRNTDGAWKKC